MAGDRPGGIARIESSMVQRGRSSDQVRPKPSRRSPEYLGMRPEAHELERRRVGLAVDEQEVRPQVAVPVVLPLAGELVVVGSGR